MSTDRKKDAILQDLDIQWRDHFHMRDQTSKSLTNSALLFLGVVGLEIKGLGNPVMIPAYVVLIVTSVFGIAVAAHHRAPQKQKFAIISKYEERLGIAELKAPILAQEDSLAGKIFTVGFIEMVHLSIGIVAISLLVAKIEDNKNIKPTHQPAALSCRPADVSPYPHSKSTFE